MRKAKRILALAAVVAAIVLSAAASSCATRSIEVKTPDFSRLPDGTYRGSCDGGIVKATVDVKLAGGRIEEVAIVEHRTGKGRKAEAIVNEVVAKQSLEVDTVSGATYSSKVILKAIETALSR